VLTRGPEGSTIFAGGQRHDIPIVKPDAVIDPTGCGDAYRAGLLYGIANGFDWQTTGELASLMGSLKIASRGGQNHAASREQIAEKFTASFGRKPW
jgi:adenosine kinase